MTAGEQIVYEFKRQLWEVGEKAKEDGIAIGEKNGEESEKKRIAKSLKDLNVAIDTIVSSTGLTAKQIQEL